MSLRIELFRSPTQPKASTMIDSSIAALADVVTLAAECRASVVELADDMARLTRSDAKFGEPIAAEDEAA